MINNKQKLQDAISYQFTEDKFLTRALTHKSYDKTNNNEQLEFLGDRILGLIIAEKLFSDNKNSNEGLLDKKFSKLVNKLTCAEIAKEISLGDYILLGSTEKASEGNKKTSILADTCEAILGAIYLDSSFTQVRKVILALWQIKFDNIAEDIIDAKSKLQEWTLKKYKTLPKYKTIGKTGPDHNPEFKIQVEFMNYKKAIGTSSSIKESEKNAALAFIEKNKINSIK